MAPTLTLGGNRNWTAEQKKLYMEHRKKLVEQIGNLETPAWMGAAVVVDALGDALARILAEFTPSQTESRLAGIAAEADAWRGVPRD